METKFIDGKAIAKAVRNEVAKEVKEISLNGSEKPKLAVVLVGEDPASQTPAEEPVEEPAEEVKTSTLTIAVKCPNKYGNVSITNTVFVEITATVGTTYARAEIRQIVLSMFPNYENVDSKGVPASYTFTEMDSNLPGVIILK